MKKDPSPEISLKNKKKPVSKGGKRLPSEKKEENDYSEKSF